MDRQPVIPDWIPLALIAAFCNAVWFQPLPDGDLLWRIGAALGLTLGIYHLTSAGGVAKLLGAMALWLGPGLSLVWFVAAVYAGWFGLCLAYALMGARRGAPVPVLPVAAPIFATMLFFSPDWPPHPGAPLAQIHGVVQ